MSGISGVKDFDSRVLASDGAPKDRPWKGRPNEVTIHTFIRTQIHHPEDNGTPKADELAESIRGLRALVTKTKIRS